MLRLAGAGLVLLGGVLLRTAALREPRLRLRLLRRLSLALDLLAQQLEGTLAPLPSLLRACRAGEESDAFFAAVLRALARGDSLGEAWRAAALPLPLPEAQRESLAALGAQLCGGEESALRALRTVSASFASCADRLAARQAERERLTTALCLSASVMALLLAL